jgi:hypothetical protein
MAHTYLLVEADGKISEVTSEQPLKLGETQKLVGGPIQSVEVGMFEGYINANRLSPGLTKNKVFGQFAGNLLIGIHDPDRSFRGLTPDELKAAKDGLAVKIS